MKRLSANTSKASVLNDGEMELAQVANSLLSALSLKEGKPVEMLLKTDNHQYSSVALPASAFKLLLSILAQMAEGKAVSLATVHAELTTQEAADLMNVSRPYFIRLLEEKKIPFRKVGTRRRVLWQDLMAYQHKIETARRKILDEVAQNEL